MARCNVFGFIGLVNGNIRSCTSVFDDCITSEVRETLDVIKMNGAYHLQS